MSGRIRKPSAKVLDIAASLRPLEPKAKKRKASKISKKSGNPSKKPSSSILDSSKRARLTNVDAEHNTASSDGPAADPGRVYCICLGQDDGTPMIQCEGCENWFHFRCIELDPTEAIKITAYFCEICTEVGAGVTEKQVEVVSDYSTDSHDDKRHDSDAHLPSEEEDSEDESFIVHDDGFSQKSKRKMVFRKGSIRKARSKRAEGLSSSDDEDEDYPGEGDVEIEPIMAKKERKPPKQQQSSSKQRRVSVIKNDSEASALATRTRQTCRSSLTNALQVILAADPAKAERSPQFAADIEAVIFEQFAEGGAPRAKYLGKVRTLVFNLKSNDVFKDKVATNQLDASGIVNVSMEELLTPEQKALAERVRAQSLRESVKEVQEAPKSRITHRGEEVVDQFATTDRNFEYKPAEVILGVNEQDQAMSPIPMSPSSPGSPTSPLTGSGRAFSPPAETFKRPSLPPMQHRRSTSFKLNEADIDIDTSFKPQSPIETKDDPMVMDLSDEEQAPRPTLSVDVATKNEGVPVKQEDRRRQSSSRETSKEATPKNDFNFDQLWGSFKSPTTPKLGQDTSPIEAEAMEVSKAKMDEEEYDPFDMKDDKRDAEDLALDAILHPENVPRSTTPPGTPPQTTPTLSRAAIIHSLPTVWSGDVIMPDEGGFPANAVQVGGRHLGSSMQIWSTFLSAGLNIDGRIASEAATDYLVKCSFAPSRELVVIALLPDTTGPNAAQPHKPPAEKAMAKHDHLVNYFRGRNRNGVCPPPEHLKRFTKDVYIVSLKASDPLPEYIELLDSHSFGEGARDADFLLAVLVMQKGSIPTAAQQPQVTPTPSSLPNALPAEVLPPIGQTGYPTPNSSNSPAQLPFGNVLSSMAGSATPSNVVASAPAPLDSNALQSLMSQPQVLASLLASNAASQIQQPTSSQASADNSTLLQSLAANPGLVQSLLSANQPAQQQTYGYHSPPQNARYGNERQSPPRRRSRSPPMRREDRNRDFNNRQRDSGWGSRGRR